LTGAREPMPTGAREPMPRGAPPFPAFIARLERYARIGSTNDVARGWLADGVDEVAVAVADEQAAGRGREGRSWTAPPGAALLLSAGFRPSYLPPERAWRLAAIVALAMADAAEDVAGLRTGTVRLKWPNDLVWTGPDPDDATAQVEAAGVRKLAGILGETEGLGTDDPRVVVGIGINADWPAATFPTELAGSMTSLREASGGRPIDRDVLLAGFLARLETRLEALRGGQFDIYGWAGRQVSTGRIVRLDRPDGGHALVRAVGVDGASGAILVQGIDGPDAGREWAVLAGEIVHLRLPSATAV